VKAMRCREVVRLYGDSWNSKKRIGDVAGARAASRWQKRWPVVKRILWETRNSSSQLAAAQALDQRWQTEREARPGNFTLTSFVTQLRSECKNDIDADFYKDGIT
jgi:hypothetical protein